MSVRELRGAGHPEWARHVELVKEAIRMVELVDNAAELQANLAGIRDDWCVDPDTMPDSELAGIATWAWKCHLNSQGEG